MRRAVLIYFVCGNHDMNQESMQCVMLESVSSSERERGWSGGAQEAEDTD